MPEGKLGVHRRPPHRCGWVSAGPDCRPDGSHGAGWFSTLEFSPALGGCFILSRTRSYLPSSILPGVFSHDKHYAHIIYIYRLASFAERAKHSLQMPCLSSVLLPLPPPSFLPLSHLSFLGLVTCDVISPLPASFSCS